MSKKYFTDASLASFVSAIKSYVLSVVSGKAEADHSHNDTYYTETEIDNMEYITTEDIDNIVLNSGGFVFVSVTQDEYDSLVASGAVDRNKYYVIVGDAE